MLKSLALMIALLLVVSSGCSANKMTIRDKEGTTTVKTKDNGKNTETQIEIEGQDGKIKITGSSEKPKDWPDDVPFYPGATVEGSASISGSEEEGMTIALSSKDSVDEVLAYYEKQLKANDWNAETNVTSSGSEGKNALMMVTKDDRTGTIIISSDDEDNITEIAIHIGKNQ